MLGGSLRVKLTVPLALVVALLLMSAPPALASDPAPKNLEVTGNPETLVLNWEEEEPERVKEFTLHYRSRPVRCKRGWEERQEEPPSEALPEETPTPKRWGPWTNQKEIPVDPEGFGYWEFKEEVPYSESNSGCAETGQAVLEYEVKVYAIDTEGKSHSSPTSHVSGIEVED